MPDSHRLMLACGGQGAQLINCRQMDLTEEDQSKVNQILESRRMLQSRVFDPCFEWLKEDCVILEMTFDAASGTWRYHLERPDKDRPNHISVVFDTMEAIAENITKADFEALFPPKRD